MAGYKIIEGPGGEPGIRPGFASREEFLEDARLGDDCGPVSRSPYVRAGRVARALFGVERANGDILFCSRDRLALFVAVHAAGWDGDGMGSLRMHNGARWPHCKPRGGGRGYKVTRFPTAADLAVAAS